MAKLLVLALALFALRIAKCQQQESGVLLQSSRYNSTLGTERLDAEAAGGRCWTQPLLSEPGTLVPATYLFTILTELAQRNLPVMEAGMLLLDPPEYNTSGTSVWVLDPYGGCRALTLPPLAQLAQGAAAVEVRQLPCGWRLHYLCMTYKDVRDIADQQTTPYNLLWTPSPPPPPPAVPLAAPDGTLPPGYRLVPSPLRLGAPQPGPGAVWFSGLAAFLARGPLVNLAGWWAVGGLGALRLVHAADEERGPGLDAADAVLAGGVAGYPWDADTDDGPAPAWATYPLPHERSALSVGSLRAAYIVRVEGCVGPAGVQRLLLTTAAGVAAAQGVGECTATFLEEAPPGGYLATLQGYFMQPFDSDVQDAPESEAAGPAIVQLQLLWALPANATQPDPEAGPLYGKGGLRSVPPRLAAAVPAAECADAKALVPADLYGSYEDGCGPGAYMCPSHMCCGARDGGRGGVCGTGTRECLSPSCAAGYGLCGALPAAELELSAHEGLDAASPSGPPAAAWTAASASSASLALGPAPVRQATLVFAAVRGASLPHKDAVSACRNLTTLGLSWQLMDLSDAVAFEASLLARGAFLALLKRNGPVWMRQRNGDGGGTGGGAICLTAAWRVSAARVELGQVAAQRCGEEAAVVCRAAWPGPDSASARSGAGTKASKPRFTAGPHAIEVTTLGGGGLSTDGSSTCIFSSASSVASTSTQRLQDGQQSPQAMRSLADSPTATPLAYSNSTAPLDLGALATVTSAIAALAVRSLLVWSDVDDEPPTAVQVLSAMALQYAIPNASRSQGRPVLRPPLVLGPYDGTYRSANASYGAGSPAAAAGASLDAYVSEAAGWRCMTLDIAGGEVIVEVAGCRGGLLEALVVRTSAGRLWGGDAGAGFGCSVPFRAVAPAGGYLVAVEVRGGSYVEELRLIWGTPLGSASLQPSPASSPPQLPASSPTLFPLPLPSATALTEPAVAPSASPLPVMQLENHTRGGSNGSGSSSQLLTLPPERRPPAARRADARAAAVGLGVGVGVGGATAVLCAAALVWWLVRSGRCGRLGPAAADRDSSGSPSTGPLPGGALGGGLPRSSDSGSGSGLQLASVVVMGGGMGMGMGMAGAKVKAGAGPPTSTSAGGSDSLGGTTITTTTITSRSSGTPSPSSLGAEAEAYCGGSAGGEDTSLGALGSGGGSPSGGGPQEIRAAAAAAAAAVAALAAARYGSDSGVAGGRALAAPAPGSSGDGGGGGAGGLRGLGVQPGAEGTAGAGGGSGEANSRERQLREHAAMFQRALYNWPSPASSIPATGTGAGTGSGVPSSRDATSVSAAAADGPAVTPPLPLPSPSSSAIASTPAAASLPHLDAAQLEGRPGSHGRSGSGPGSASELAPSTDAPTATGGGGDGNSTLQDGGRPALSAAAEAELLGAAAAVAVAGGRQPPLPPQLQSSPPHAGGGAEAAGGPEEGQGDECDGGAEAEEAHGQGAGPGPAAELLLGRDVLVDPEDPNSYLGHGTSGIVRRGSLREPGGGWRPVAVKLLNPPPGDSASDAYSRHLRTLVQEITILGRLRHPNVVRLLGGSLAPGASFLVEELCEGTLGHAIYEAPAYDLACVLRWCADIARGLSYLHPHIMHRDLKPSNVLLDGAGCAKISDFGLARFKAHTTLNTRDAEVGTTCYMAPECFVSADVKMTAACDVYSLGVMMNELVTRQRPWSGVRAAVVGFRVAVVGERPEAADEGHPLCPPPLRQLIAECWAQRPEERPASAEVLARLEAMARELGGGR